jgi:hypothetical protein
MFKCNAQKWTSMAEQNDEVSGWSLSWGSDDSGSEIGIAVAAKMDSFLVIFDIGDRALWNRLDQDFRVELSSLELMHPIRLLKAAGDRPDQVVV